MASQPELELTEDDVPGTKLEEPLESATVLSRSFSCSLCVLFHAFIGRPCLNKLPVLVDSQYIIKLTLVGYIGRYQQNTRSLGYKQQYKRFVFDGSYLSNSRHLLYC